MQIHFGYIYSNCTKKLFFLKKPLLLLVFWCFLGKIFAFELSPKAQLSIITGERSTELHTLFGHSAIRLYDPLFGIDIMYNYGAFDFETPNFMLKFVRGKLLYELARDHYPSFFEYYRREGRTIEEQVLDLTQAQKQQLFDFLENEYKPENRKYLYDFFLNNCSTRVRDALQKTFKIRWKTNNPNEKAYLKRTVTYRHVISLYAKESWVRLGMNLMLGLPADKILDGQRKMFMPDYLRDRMQVAYLVENGVERPLVKEFKVAFQGNMARQNMGYFNAYSVLWTFFGLILFLTLYEYQKKIWLRGVDIFLFAFIGFIGLFFVLMWVGTDHKHVIMNMHNVWCVPTHLVLAFFLFQKPFAKKWVQQYWFFNFVVLTLFLMNWFWLPQEMPMAILPVVLAVWIRNAKMCFVKI